MASKPGILTEWPWATLGRFKYILLAPFVLDSLSPLFFESDTRKWDLSYSLTFPFLLWRVIHNQIWISFSRFRTSKSKNRILDKSIEFEQVDRESNWDDNIILQGLMFYLGQKYLEGGSHLPLWRTDGVVMTILLHTGPVEFLYYWLHRSLHHHFLYSRYHSHHHSSIATEPITSVIHPFGEHLMYFALFMIPLLNMVFTGTGSIVAFAAYITYIDFMNNMGHCNFEFIPSSLFTTFPFLKCIFYTASYHSLHHTQFRTNYALFMPMYDYIYGTVDKSSDELYETSLKRAEESPDVVHLTHPTTPDSIYHLRLGFASLASEPYTRGANNKYYFIIKWVLWPLTFLWSILFQRMLSHTFVLERNIFDDHQVTKKLLQVQTWAIPRYSNQYKGLTKQRGTINSLIEKAILDADKAGAKVISLGLLNQGGEMNKNGEVYIQKHPNLKIKIVDGSSLAASIVLNSITNLKTQQQVVVMMRGRLTKLACYIALALCQRGIQVVVKLQSTDDFEKLRSRFFSTSSASQASLLAANNLIPSTKYSAHGNRQVWLVDDEFSSEEHMSAPKETIFIPYSQIPPWSNFKKNPKGAANILRKDCVYYSTPAMMIPSSLENVHSCENWLPRRVMSAWRVAGMLHALEDWEGHECGNWFIKENDNMIDKVWAAGLRHGFRPYYLPVPCTSAVIAA